MVKPNLLNALKIEIEKLDRAGTLQDNLRREPVNKVKRSASFKIKAQVQWMSGANDTDNKPSHMPSGVDNPQTGYFIIRVKDLTALGQTLARGDKLVKIGSRAVSLFITDVNYHAQYEDQGDFTLIKANFTDRIGKK